MALTGFLTLFIDLKLHWVQPDERWTIPTWRTSSLFHSVSAECLSRGSMRVDAGPTCLASRSCEAPQEHRPWMPAASKGLVKICQILSDLVDLATMDLSSWVASKKDWLRQHYEQLCWHNGSIARISWLFTEDIWYLQRTHWYVCDTSQEDSHTVNPTPEACQLGKDALQWYASHSFQDHGLCAFFGSIVHEVILNRIMGGDIPNQGQNP